MMELVLILKTAGNVKKSLDGLIGRVNLGTARAADVITGQLRVASAQDPLHARTGNLAREWKTERLGIMEFRAVNRLPYARILEEGGTIEPKSAKMLAIPIGEGVTSRGVARFASPRDVPDLFTFRSKAGNLIMAKRRGSSMDIYFVLKEKVRIPAYRFASRAVFDAKDRAIAEIKRALTK